MTAQRLPVLCLALGLLLGWLVNGWRGDAALAEVERRHAEMLASAQLAARIEEQRRIAAIEEVQRNAQEQLTSAAADAAAADRTAAGLRGEVARLSRRPARCPAAAGGGEAVDPAGLVLAELLLEVERAGRELAAEADRRRVAGLACESAYGALMGK